MKETFVQKISQSYAMQGPTIYVGAGVLNGEIIPEAEIHLSLKMMNRHGLVTGATGSGKTRTLQLLAEQLSRAGVSVFMPDIKGDLSGLAKEGTANEKILERSSALSKPFAPDSFPIEMYSLSGKLGAPMRATVTEFGPVLLGKIMGLNEVQRGVLSLLFKYADDKNLPIVDLNDLKKVLNFLSEGDGALEIKDTYGKISGATAGTILRKIVVLEQQGLTQLFGEKSFDIEDLMGQVDGRGRISVLNVSDVQDQPALFSTFLLSLLAEIYQTLPEAGDLEKPKLIFFLDEAHLLFKDAPKPFLDQIDQVIRLIRSKGVGIFFCTQLAQDLPPNVLAQLGNRIHHVIRAFTPNDVKALKETVKSLPNSSFYELEEQFTMLGTGQALITVLNEKGIPSEVAVVHLAPPTSTMGPLSPDEYERVVREAEFFEKYKDAVDPVSAFEILNERMTRLNAPQEQEEARPGSKRKNEKSTFEEMMASPMARQVGRELVRGVFGMLFGKAPRRTRRQ